MPHPMLALQQRQRMVRSAGALSLTPEQISSFQAIDRATNSDTAILAQPMPDVSSDPTGFSNYVSAQSRQGVRNTAPYQAWLAAGKPSSTTTVSNPPANGGGSGSGGTRTTGNGGITTTTPQPGGITVPQPSAFQKAIANPYVKWGGLAVLGIGAAVGTVEILKHMKRRRGAR